MYGQENADLFQKLDCQERGIIPRVSKEIFTKLDQQRDSSAKIQIALQMVEIYKEQFVDLLSPQPILTGNPLLDDKIQ